MQDVQLHVFDASMDGVGDPWGHHLPCRGCPGLQFSLPDAGNRLENDNLAVGLIDFFSISLS